jgi:preprotein translocase subunit YajC
MSLIKKEVKMTENLKRQSFAEKEMKKQQEKKDKVVSIGGITGSSLDFGLKKIELEKLSKKLCGSLCEGGSEGDLG